MGSKYVAGATLMLACVLVRASVSVAQTTSTTSTAGSVIHFSYDTFGNRTTASQAVSTAISDPTLSFVNPTTFYSRTAPSASTTTLTTAITTTISGGTPPYLYVLTYVGEGSSTPNAARAFVSGYGYQLVDSVAGPGAATTPSLTTSCLVRPCYYAEQWLLTITDADGNSASNQFGITHTYN